MWRLSTCGDKARSKMVLYLALYVLLNDPGIAQAWLLPAKVASGLIVIWQNAHPDYKEMVNVFEKQASPDLATNWNWGCVVGTSVKVAVPGGGLTCRT